MEIRTVPYMPKEGLNPGEWLFRMGGYGFSDSPILADDRSWDQAGWGLESFDTVWHYYPPYHNRSACHTNQIAPNKGGTICRPKKLHEEPQIRPHGLGLRRFSVCRTCQNIKRAVERR